MATMREKRIKWIRNNMSDIVRASEIYSCPDNCRSRCVNGATCAVSSSGGWEHWVIALHRAGVPGKAIRVMRYKYSRWASNEVSIDLGVSQYIADMAPEDIRCGRTKGMTGRRAIHYMVLFRDLPSLDRLIAEEREEIHAKDLRGMTPLHLSCQRGHSGIARLLLENGANPSIRDNEGRTALYHATTLPQSDSGREDVIDAFRQYAPEAVMQMYCVERTA